MLLFLVFTATVLPAQSKKAEIYSEGVGTIDLSFLYSADDVYKMAEAYGEAGRQAYIYARMSFDVIWPIVYMLFLTTTISYLFSKVYSPNHKFQKLNLIPILSMIFDYFENGIASLVMLSFPKKLIFLSNILPGFTLFKWIFVAGSFIILLFALGVWLVRLIKINRISTDV